MVFSSSEKKLFFDVGKKKKKKTHDHDQNVTIVLREKRRNIFFWIHVKKVKLTLFS